MCNQDFLLPLSGIQHFAFCRRQWALIHIENLWAENVRTVEGNILHSLRFYLLGNHYKNKVIHIGAKQTYTPEEPLMI